MKSLICILTLFSVGILTAQSNIKVNQKAPKINITDWIENVPTDKNLDNKYIVLEFWATWCGPCIAAVPHMNKIQKDFKQNDLYFISITDESVEKVKRTISRIDFNSIVVTDLSKQTQINFGDGVKGLDDYPLTVLIDKNGIIKWIGTPKELDSTIMSKFLSNKNTEQDVVNLQSSENQKKQTQTYNFIELIKNKDLKFYFDLQETESNVSSKQVVGSSIIVLNAFKMENIYSDIFKIKSNQLDIPKSVENKSFSLQYKNLEDPENVSILENEILKKLNLIKHTEVISTKLNLVSIKDQSLLEGALEKSFSAKSYADDKVIFAAYTIDNMLGELPKIMSYPFKLNSENENKYDFIINIKSESEIINSLKSYGLSIEEEEQKIEHISLLDK